MNITCHQNELLKAVGLLTQIISNKPQSRPILSNILLESSKGILTLSATNLEMGLRVNVSLEQSFEDGTILLPAHQLLGILRESPSDSIRLEVIERTAIMSGENFQYKLPAYANEEFPDVPELNGSEHRVPTQTLQRILKEVSFAMNRDKNRFQLNSLLLCFEGSYLEGVATDQVRLAYSKSLLEDSVDKELVMILPAKSIPVINTILNDENAECVQVIKGDSQLTIKFNNGHFIIRLVDAQFPNYRSAFSNFASVPDLIINTQRFSQAMRQMMLLTCDNAKNIMMILEQGLLTLKVSTPLGEGKTEIKVNYEGEAITIGINPQFVQDFLKEVGSQNIDTIRLKVVGSRKPIIMSPHDDYVYFMSPISS